MNSAPAVVVPARLNQGDTVSVISPSMSQSLIMEFDNTRWINERMKQLGLTLKFAEHIAEDDMFRSASIASRVADLHAAFADSGVAGIITTTGGFNANELLPYLDWDLIAAHPKVFCGYSDITVLANAIFAKTGLVTYVGAHWSSWGMRDHFEPTGQWFTDATFGQRWSIQPSQQYTDDLWFMDQDQRSIHATEGPWILNEGTCQGTVIGGNLGTFNLLAGTAYQPELAHSVLFVEEDEATHLHEFTRQLTSLLQQRGAEHIAGLAIGRFQRASKITREQLEAVVAKFPALSKIPVVANLDFGHTSPMATLPIGGQTKLAAVDGQSTLEFWHPQAN